MTKFNIIYLNKTANCLSGSVKSENKTVIHFNLTPTIESFHLQNNNGVTIKRAEWDQITNYLKNVSHHHFRGDYLWVD